MMTIKKVAKANDYEAICGELGFNADLHFMEISKTGSISFSIGKPDEIRALAYAARHNGYSVSRKLEDAAKR